MSHGLNNQQVQELKDVFAMFDKDGNGSISTGELKSVMESLGQNASEVSFCS